MIRRRPPLAASRSNSRSREIRKVIKKLTTSISPQVPKVVPKQVGEKPKARNSPRDSFLASPVSEPSTPDQKAPSELPENTEVVKAGGAESLKTLESELRQASADSGGFLMVDAGKLSETYRQQARSEAPDLNEREAELTALHLLERDLSKLPQTLTVSRPAPQLAESPFPAALTPVSPNKTDPKLKSLGGMAASGAYTANLGAVLSGGMGGLAPAVFKVLSGFRPELLVDQRQGGWRYLGTHQEQTKAAGTVSTVKLSNGGDLLGAWSAEEVQKVEGALKNMESKLPGSSSMVKSFALGVYLGGRENEQGEQNFAVAGLAYGQKEIGVVRTSTGSFANTVYHEAGHEKDKALGKNGRFYSERPGSPFLSSTDPNDYVSGYAMVLGREDFAETHADLVTNFDKIQANSDLSLWANGPLGAKRRDILQSYGLNVPKPSERLEKALKEVDSGDSPFGWKSDDGSLIAAKADFEKSVKTMMKMWDPSQPLPWFMAQGDDGDKQRWIVEKIGHGRVAENPPVLSTGGGAFGGALGGGMAGGMGMAGGYGSSPVETAPVKQDLGSLVALGQKCLKSRIEYEAAGEEAFAEAEALKAKGETVPPALAHGVNSILSFCLLPLQSKLGKEMAPEQFEQCISEQPGFLRKRLPKGNQAAVAKYCKDTLSRIQEDNTKNMELQRKSFDSGVAPTPPRPHPTAQRLTNSHSQKDVWSRQFESQVKQGGSELREALMESLPPELAKNPALVSLMNPHQAMVGGGYESI
jgi:hypothetical protein